MGRLVLFLAGLAVFASVVVASSGGATQAEARWVITDLGTLPGGDWSDAVAINNRAQVIGNSFDEGPAFLWQNGKMRALGTLGGKSSTAVAINDRGQVVGDSYTKAKDKDGYPIWHAFLSEKGTMRDLGTLGGQDSEAAAINDQGQVVGRARHQGNAPRVPDPPRVPVAEGQDPRPRDARWKGELGRGHERVWAGHRLE